MLASIRERRYEIYLLRVIGAPPIFVFLLIELEALLISAFSIFIAALTLYLSLIGMDDFLASRYGLNISLNIISENNVLYAILIMFATAVAAAIPSFTAYKSVKQN